MVIETPRLVRTSGMNFFSDAYCNHLYLNEEIYKE